MPREARRLARMSNRQSSDPLRLHIRRGGDGECLLDDVKQFLERLSVFLLAEPQSSPELGGHRSYRPARMPPLQRPQTTSRGLLAPLVFELISSILSTAYQANVRLDAPLSINNI